MSPALEDKFRRWKHALASSSSECPVTLNELKHCLLEAIEEVQNKNTAFENATEALFSSNKARAAVETRFENLKMQMIRAERLASDGSFAYDELIKSYKKQIDMAKKERDEAQAALLLLKEHIRN